ncbi:MAG: tRNA preQ1(34) S-adenosylmethionine ribosyltransferase-isomerase QueA [Gemmatimonadota bacterium]|jgi:S-adenosylmethionine:tRNA ribosyltransferase-isomerase|nr:tRNA preQ1(34) S-adenosylmethionine ribosyltransferase-isomerase QueA [Gemmatimonadota bacterium]MDP7032677.1 tRNA preQ1(34) S-adenosylmethionine ribosyltransferase-isomerase QueA [Gemmatimonadota bacterium]
MVREPRMSAVSLKASDLDYDLPKDRIAQRPAARRRDSRLLHLPADGSPRHGAFADFPALLNAGDLLVLNETRVIPARFQARRATGGAVEVFLLRRTSAGWEALARPARRLASGEVLRLGDGDASIRVLERLEGGKLLVELSGDEDSAGHSGFWKHGQVPLPPYVHRDPDEADRDRYQTVFARVPGAVAAPTAGLHLDPDALESVRARGVEIARLVLHVGAGTFRPLPDGDLSGVRLDAESYEVPAATLAAVRAAHERGGRVVAVGTTVVRALESLDDEDFLTGSDARGETRLFIRPEDPVRRVDALLTNFHLPKSSLLCLVAAFSGLERILSAYQEAVRERYRFYSYGDATFLEKRA